MLGPPMLLYVTPINPLVPQWELWERELWFAVGLRRGVELPGTAKMRILSTAQEDKGEENKTLQ